MKKLIYLITIGCVLLACEKDLDLSSKTELTDGSFWKSAADFEKAANAFYTTLGGYGNFDANSDIAGRGNTGESNGSMTVPQNDGNWNGAYSTLRDIHILLEKAEGKDFAQLYVAEARWFRAKTYYELVKRFGDVVLVKEVLDINSEELNLSRSPRAEVVDLIMEDLNFAESILPEESELSQVGRLTKGAANALKARVALFEGTWAKYHGIGNATNYLTIAQNSAKKVMDSDEYTLFNYPAEPNESYRYLFIDEGDDNSGQILASRYSFEIRQQNLSYSVGNRGEPPITRKLADMYLSIDGLPIEKSPLFQGRGLMTSEYKNRDLRMTGTMILPGKVNTAPLAQIPEGAIIYPDLGSSPGLYRPQKFLSENPLASEWNGGTYFIHYLRYAEVLLIYAEATYELTGSISDEDLNLTINKLRERAGVAPLTNNLVDNNGLNMLEEIRRERTIELALEGYRRDDLRRWKTAEIELSKALLGVRFEGTEWETFYPDENPNLNAEGDIIVDEEGNRIFEQKQYLYPIPNSQRTLNPNLEQNPGW